ncbi:hypothetical protein [Roseitalea porphyridii]|uniref:Uncharacterized protein n=1 Tax=Roseitalea porphyridii TaxID=1852022 RepID=A0A4P6UYF0_9HYPH|nr:hypothetical protein [Roseitalea porphyridii]QBK30147.1 hypothetical protein E0E05_05765 [Roseitalea porphyridii]
MLRKEERHPSLAYGHFGLLVSYNVNPFTRLDAYHQFYKIGVIAALFDAAAFWIGQLERGALDQIADAGIDFKKHQWIAPGLKDASSSFGNRSFSQLVPRPNKDEQSELELLRWVAVRVAMQEGFKDDDRFERAAEMLAERKYDYAVASSIKKSVRGMSTAIKKQPLQEKFYPSDRVRQLALSEKLEIVKGRIHS